MKNKLVLNILLAVLSGILIFLSFPPANLFFCAWAALVPLFYLIGNEKPLSAGLLSFLAGLAANIGIFYWLYPMIKLNTGSIVQSVLCVLLLSAYMAVYFFIWGFCAALVIKRFSKPVFFVFACFSWVGLEYLRTYFLTGFPWGILGYSQWAFVDVAQVAEFTGVYGVSLILVASSYFLYLFIAEKKPASAALFILFPFIMLFCGHSLKKRDFRPQTAINVAVLQGNIDQYKKWNISFQNEILSGYNELAKSAAKGKPAIIIWPETSVPGYLPADPFLLKWIRTLVKETGTYNIVGAPFYDGIKEYANATFLFGPDGEMLSAHKKNHLVPFGEYVPFRKYLEPYFGVLNTLGDFNKGTDTTPFRAGETVLGTTICSENFFGSLVRRVVISGAQIIVNQTNDAWFLKTAAAEQHFIMNVFRAIENRRWVIVSGNTGISGIINEKGEVKKRTDIFTAGFFNWEVSPGNYRTFYTRFGDLFAVLCSILSLVLIGYGILGGKRGIYDR